MFETSQQEEGSSTTKIVGGVIAVVAVILVVVYFLFLHGQPPAGTATGAGKSPSTAAADTAKPDPLRDLSIIRSNLRRDQTQTMAMWDIIVANRSRGVAYRNIQYATNYYNASDAVIYHNEGTLPDVIEPGDQHTFESVNDGLYPVGTTRYTIEIKGADAAQ